MYEMARYHLQTGGKRLRGQLVLAEAEVIDLDPQKALVWAAACELLHNATLIHDDIQDHDPMRRGQPSLWKKYGVSQAINVGDLFIFRAFNLTSQLANPLLTELLAEISEQLVRGQVDELNALVPVNNNYWDNYLKMTRLKTGVLFQLPVHGVHVIQTLNRSFSQTQAWLDLGACYQIYDDIRDFKGLKQTGQNQKDFEEKRVNALVAWLSRFPQHHHLIQTYLATEPDESHFQTVIKELNQCVCENQVIQELTDFAQQRIQVFQEKTSEKTRSIVMKYIEKAAHQGDMIHETAYA